VELLFIFFRVPVHVGLFKPWRSLYIMPIRL